MPRKSNFIIFFLLALLLLTSLSCTIFTGGKTETAKTPTPGATKDIEWSILPDGSIAPQVEPTATAETPKPGGGNSYLGDYFAQDGYFYSAMEFADPAAPGRPYKKQAGMRLVAARIIVGNQNGERLYFSISDVSIRDSNGDVWESEFDAVENEAASAYLDPGERVLGWLGFTIPEGVKAVSLEYLYDFIDGKSITVPLAAPPAGREPRRVNIMRSARAGLKLGQVAAGSGYTLEALQVGDPAEPAFTEYYDVPKGFRLVQVELEIGNTTTEIRTYADYELNLVDSNGFLCPVQSFEMPDALTFGEIKPGGSVRGWVIFPVAEDARLESIKYFSESMDEPLYAGLAE